MMHLLKSLLFFPLRFIGAWVLLLGRVSAAFLFVGAILISVLKLGGSLSTSWWIVLACWLAGIAIRLITELYVQSLVWLDSGRVGRV